MPRPRKIEAVPETDLPDDIDDMEEEFEEEDEGGEETDELDFSSDRKRGWDNKLSDEDEYEDDE